MQCADAKLQIRTYTRDDVNLLETINHYDVDLGRSSKSSIPAVTVKLHKANRPDGRIVLVKAYHGSPSQRKTTLVSPPFFADSWPFLIVS